MSITDRFPVRMIRVILPNAITISAIMAGYLSILETFHGDYSSAAALILIACVLDMFDGRVARMMQTTSEFGVQFDSLADMVNYGVAPSLLFYFLYFGEWGVLGTALGFLPVMCAGIRLARFNVTSDPDIPTRYFIGLPTTIGAMVLAGFVVFAEALPPAHNSSQEAALLVMLTALLMVSNVQYEKSNILSLRYILKTRRIITAIIIIGSLLSFPKTAFFAWGLLYILYGATRAAVRTILHGNDDDVEAVLDEEAAQLLP